MSEKYLYYDEVYKGFRIKIMQDTCPQNLVKDGEPFGRCYFYHRNYDLSSDNRFPNPEDLNEYMAENKKDLFYLLVRGYEHGGLTISTSNGYPYNDRWDSGALGYIIITKDEVRSRMNWKYLTQKRIEKVYEYLNGTIKTYDQYLQGEVYGFQIEDKDGDIMDSCWGYYGYPNEDSYIVTECKAIIDNMVKDDIKKHCEQLKSQLKHKVPLHKRIQLDLSFCKEVSSYV